MLVGKAKECEGAHEIEAGYFESLEQCAHACDSLSEMFVYGTREHGVDNQYCRDDNNCKCMCEENTIDYTCKTAAHDAYNLYAFKK